MTATASRCVARSAAASSSSRRSVASTATRSGASTSGSRLSWANSSSGSTPSTLPPGRPPAKSALSADGFGGPSSDAGQAHRAGDAGGVHRAVAVRDLVQVLLVVVLGVVELAERDDLGADLAVAGRAQPLLEQVAAGLRGRLLLRALGVDRRAVLGADVVALAHALGRVVLLPELLEQALVGDDGRVEHHQHDLGVPGTCRADLLVRRVRRVAAGVARRRRVDARGLPEHLLDTPEAAGAEDGGLQALREGRPDAV